MHQERSGTPGEVAGQVERAILVMLLGADEQRPGRCTRSSWRSAISSRRQTGSARCTALG
jgi:hypothetical protein